MYRPGKTRDTRQVFIQIYANPQETAFRGEGTERKLRRGKLASASPLNLDSLGIEIVGSYDKVKKQYEAISPLQNSSLKWLINELYTHFNMTSADVYRHPEVSYKMPTEASSATW